MGGLPPSRVKWYALNSKLRFNDNGAGEMRFKVEGECEFDPASARSRLLTFVGWGLAACFLLITSGRLLAGDVMSTAFFAFVTLLTIPPLWREPLGSMPLWGRIALGSVLFFLGVAFSSGDPARNEFQRRCIENGGKPSDCYSQRAWDDYVDTAVEFEKMKRRY